MRRIRSLSGMTFKDGSTDVGSYTSLGAWTLGGTSGVTTSHTIQAQPTGDYVLKILNSNSTNGQSGGVRISAGAGASDSVFTVSNYNNTLNYGICEGYGSWRFGPALSSGVSVNHYFQSGGDTALRLNCPTGYNSLIYFQKNSANKWVLYNDQSTDRLYVTDAETDNGVYLAQGSNSWTSMSDARTKKNVADLQKGLSVISAVRPVEFQFNSDADDKPKRIGFIAQELNEVLPEAVATHDTAMWGISATELIPVLVKAIQELTARIETLEAANG